jgi:hypothetical protein
MAWIVYRPGYRGGPGSLTTPPTGTVTPGATDAGLWIGADALERAGVEAAGPVAGAAPAAEAEGSPRADATPTTIVAARTQAPKREGRFM